LGAVLLDPTRVTNRRDSPDALRERLTAHGSQIHVHYREKREGEEVFVCTIANDAAVVVS
jgi:hypothetical protein